MEGILGVFRKEDLSLQKAPNIISGVFESHQSLMSGLVGRVVLMIEHLGLILISYVLKT